MSFDYDNWGRIDEVSQNGSEQKITLVYELPYKVVSTDETGTEFRLSYNHWGQPAQLVDSESNTMGLLYDEDYNLVHIKRFDGFSEKQTFDEGLLTESENALGEEELSSYTENFRLRE